MTDFSSYSSDLGFKLWIYERFPLKNLPLFVVIYVLSAMVSTSNKDLPLTMFIAGSIMSCSYFLLIRIIDEHKDYDEDCERYPKRVLQRGLITLNQLKLVALGCILIQLSIMLLYASSITLIMKTWSVLIIWTLLMSKEFFIKTWLNRNLFFYALSHTLIMPLIIIWLTSFSSTHIEINRPLLLLMFLSFFSALTFEITRKCKGDDEDTPYIKSYSQSFGRPLSIAIIVTLILTMYFDQYLLLKNMCQYVPEWFYFINITLFISCLGQLVCFLITPDKHNRNLNEIFIGVNMLTGYLLCALIIQLY
ncbi:UbiA family prenyltransferase [Pantoea ananatis]|uniref:UbiA family prenyltransferase n=1 Tax=Pantoea ananas TaxID=553 RepID=UPI0015884117|nr:UbiA family prenyltransferase [Pantoea ananatis]MBA4820186.1 UbiA family prenyltransferase [Pantoea ananatis]QKV90074.1 UbiA family prenyltransferase [Pantoea ananatis]